MNFTIDPGLAVIGSVAIGVITTFLGFLLSEQVRQWTLRKSVASALLAEATAELEQHMEVIGKHIEATPEGQLPQQHVVWDSEPFPIFKQLSGNLGLFSKDEAGQLAQAYTQTFGFIASLKSFMERMRRVDDLRMQIAAADHVGDTRNKEAFREEHRILVLSQVDFFKYIKVCHKQVTGRVYATTKSILERYAK